MQGATDIITVIIKYNEGTWFVPLFLAALVYLFWKGDRRCRWNLAIVLGAAVLLIFNDVSFQLVSKVVGEETYYRFLWMVPIVPILGYVLVDLFVRQKRKLGKALVVAAAVFLLACGGTSCVDGSSLKSPSQVNYLNQEAVTIAELIEEDKEMEFPRVAVEYDLVMSMRLANNKIVNFIKRNTYVKQGKIKKNTGRKMRQYRAYELVNGRRQDVEKVKAAITKGKIHYFVIATKYEMDDLMLEAGCSILTRTENYTIYRC